MPYQPSKKESTAAPIHDAATSATSATTETLPPDLSDAVTRAEQLLSGRQRSMDTLASFSVDLPKILRELSAARPGAELDRVRLQRETAARDRQELIRQLRDEEPALVSAQRQVEASRQVYSAALVSAFQEKYAEAVSAFQAVLAEGAGLARCLRAEVRMDLPVHVAQPWKDGGDPSTRPPWWIPDGINFDKAPIVSPDVGTATHPADPAAVRIGHSLDGLESAIRFCEAIRSYERRVIDMAAKRYDQTTTFDPAGVFTVAKPMTDLLTGAVYATGTLIDTALLPAGLLLRAFMAKCIRAAGSASSAPASASIGPPTASLPFVDIEVPQEA